MSSSHCPYRLYLIALIIKDGRLGPSPFTFCQLFCLVVRVREPLGHSCAEDTWILRRAFLMVRPAAAQVEDVDMTFETDRDSRYFSSMSPIVLAGMVHDIVEIVETGGIISKDTVSVMITIANVIRSAIRGACGDDLGARVHGVRKVVGVADTQETSPILSLAHSVSSVSS